MKPTTKFPVSLHPRRNTTDAKAAVAMYTTTQDMARSTATPTPPAPMFLATATAPSPARAPRSSSALRSLRDVEAAHRSIHWPAHARARVVVHLDLREQRIADRWDRAIGLVSAAALIGIFAKLLLS